MSPTNNIVIAIHAICIGFGRVQWLARLLRTWPMLKSSCGARLELNSITSKCAFYERPSQSRIATWRFGHETHVQKFDVHLTYVQHSGSVQHPLHTKEGDEISMFLVLSLGLNFNMFWIFLAHSFCYAVSSCVYDPSHPYLVSECLFLAENQAFPYQWRLRAHPWTVRPY